MSNDITVATVQEDQILLAANNHELVKLGAGAGLSITLIIQLIQTFGPALAKLLIDMLSKRKDDPKLKAWGGGWELNTIRQLLVTMIKTYRTEIMDWLDDQENKLLDLIIKKLEA